MKTLLTILVITSLVVGYYFFPAKPLPTDKSIDHIIVLKSEHKLMVYAKDELLKTYTISLGKDPIGDKMFEGDNRTPEGDYFITDKNASSAFHKNLGISYPNNEDIEQAARLNKNVGGGIKIHGLKNGQGYIGKFHGFLDWTAGCIALTDEEVDELYEYVPIGTPITIKP